MINYFVVLGVPPCAKPEQIKTRYRDLTRLHHPDAGGDTAMFAALTEAGSVLTDDTRRVQHLEQLHLLMAPCSRCNGMGGLVRVLVPQDSTTRRCPKCDGAGFFPKERV